MEEENKKSEFLKKQRIRTMQKDIAKLRGEEISDLEPEREEIKVEKIKEIMEEKAKEKEEIETKRRITEEEEKKRQEELLAEKKAAGQAEAERIKREEAEREITEEEKRKKAAGEEERRRKEKILAKKTEEQRLTDIDKELANIGLKKGALNKEKKQFLTEIKSFETQLEPLLKEEAVIENKIREIEELEKKASPEKKSQIEKKRWETDARRRDIEKAKWLILEEIEKVEEKIKDIESKYQETSSEEEQFKKEKEEILQKRREEELIREKARLKNEIFQLNDEKKIIENRENELSAKKDNLETELGKVLNEEKITEEVIQDMEAKEKETSDPKEQRRIEKERWKVDDDRKNLERKKWELEKEKKELSAELKKVELEYQVILEKENLLKERLKEINRSLKISPEGEESKLSSSPFATAREGGEELPTKETLPEEKDKKPEEEITAKDKEEPFKKKIEEERIKKEEEERERRRLIKEEMKKRIAEEAERRQEEMLWKERRKFLADNQIEAGEEGPSSEDSKIKKEAPEAFISILPPKPSLLEKILIRTVTIAILLLVIGFFYWLFAVEKFELFKEKIIPIEEEMPPVPPAEEETIEKPEAPESEVQLPIINERILNFGYYTPTTPRTIDTIIIHSTYDASGNDPYSVDGVVNQFQLYRVTSHYLIARDGTIYQLAPDRAVAYHAGVSIMPDGNRKNVINNFSLGIELIYEETESPNETQYQSLSQLVNYLKEKYLIPVENILGQNQIAPERKTDPWNFDWEKFMQMLK